MNNSLDRLIAGIIATLRSDVIDNVESAYAKGQAIGVVDLLNNIGAHLEWKRAPLLAAIATREAVIAEVRALLGMDAATPGPDVTTLDNSEALLAERDRLDAEISALVTRAFGLNAPQGADADAARAALRKHMHDDAETEMKLVRKPLFAEIARGEAAKD